MPETVAPLFGAASYLRPIDPSAIVGHPAWRAELLAHYAWIERCFPRVPAAALFRIGPGSLLDRSLVLDTAEGARPLYETHRSVDLPYLIETGTGETEERLPSDRHHLYLGSIGSFNYGHFLVDDLTRFDAVHLSRPPDGRGLCVLMTAHDAVIDPLREAALRLVVGDGVPFEIRFLRRTRRYRFDAMLYPSPVTVHPAVKHPEALERMTARAVAAAASSRIRARKRLFVVRRPERGRALVNGAEIARILAQRRFVAVDPEGLAFDEQVALFAGAEIVIGQMGAAMGNTVFCRPGTRVLYLAPTGWTEPFYWDLAAARGHRYAACYGPATGDAPASLADFTIAPSDIFEALDAWG